MTLDIEQQVARIPGQEVRDLVAEAWRCYGAGAFRACISLTWAAVGADLIDKLERLHEEGEGAAASLVQAVSEARAGGLSRAAVRAMQEAERDVIDTAVQLELLDAVTARELERLRDDRNLCVHPSARPLGEAYSPSAEYARAHLAAALDGLLTLPAIQGRKAIERFREHVAAPTFVPTPSYLGHAFYEQVKPTARRRIVELAAKHALLELSIGEPHDAQVIADRMSTCLHVFAERDRGAVRSAIGRIAERFGSAEDATLLAGIGRAGDLDVLWESLPAHVIDRINGLVEDLQVPTVPWSAGPSLLIDVISVVASPEARARVPALTAKFGELQLSARAAVMGRRVDPYFVECVPSVLAEAGGWRTAEAVTAQAVLPYATLLDLDTLDHALQAWAENAQCRTASAMLDYALELYRRTIHLRPEDGEVWRRFLESVRKHEDVESPWRYEDLEEGLRT